MDTSANSIGRRLSELSKYKVTEAVPRRAFLSVPAKMTSSDFLPRKFLSDCSPIAQRIASATLDLPEPLGPTITVMPRFITLRVAILASALFCSKSGLPAEASAKVGRKSKTVLLAKDLKPLISSFFKYMFSKFQNPNDKFQINIKTQNVKTLSK